MTAAPWAGLLILTSLPFYLLQVHFLDRLFEVGDKAASYGNLLGDIANNTILAFLLALWGRAVYARACRLAITRSVRPGSEALRVPAPALAAYLLTGSTALLVLFMLVPTIAGVIAGAVFAGVAVGTLELNERVGLVEPFRNVVRHAAAVTMPAAMALIFGCALVVAWINIIFAFRAIVWLATSAWTFDAPRWPVLFSGSNRTFLLLTLAGAMLAVQPFWIAAYVIYVAKQGAAQSGDDLRAWFEELRRAS